MLQGRGMLPTLLKKYSSFKPMGREMRPNHRCLWMMKLLSLNVEYKHIMKHLVSPPQ